MLHFYSYAYNIRVFLKETMTPLVDKLLSHLGQYQVGRREDSMEIFEKLTQRIVKELTDLVSIH
jgi:hypothetical protein